jgi:hypothetical protein
MKTFTTTPQFPLRNRFILAGLLALAFCFMLSPHAFAQGVTAATNDFSIGLGDSKLEAKASAAGTLVTNIARIVCLGFAGYEFFIFMKDKKFVNLIYCFVGCVGIGLSKTLVSALFNFGSTT